MSDLLFEHKNIKVWDFDRSSSPKWIFKEVIDDDGYGIKDMQFAPGDVVVDIGANIGIFSIYLALMHPEVAIYSFESSKTNYGHLLKNIAENGVKNVTPINLAITEDGRDCYCSTVEGGNTGGADIFQAVGEKCGSMTLDAFINNNGKKIRLLKIDCEGAEYEILYGLKQWDKIEALSAEIHSVHSNYYSRNYSRSELIKFIRSKLKDARLVADDVVIP